MIETNPYRLEEAEWTPGNVYDIIPPGALSHTGFEYSEGSDNVDSEKAHNSLLSGVASFFSNLLGGVGKVLGGAVEFGVGILGGIVEGVTNLIGGFARAVGSIFGGGNNNNNDQPIEPPEPIFNPIKTNLEGAIQPHLDDIEEAKGKIEAAQQEQESIKEDIAAHGRDLSTALSKADKGIADAKAAQNSANKAISDITTKSGELSAEIEAQRKASIAREDALKKEINPKIEAAQSRGDNAMTEAEKAVSWLKNPVEIGSSLIALDVETKEPHYMQWAGTPTTPSTEGLPFTRAVRVNSSTKTRRDAPAEMRVPVKVSPDITYKWSVWVYSNKAKTEIGFLTTSDSIGSCVEETTYKSDGRTSTSEEGIFVKDIPTAWSKHEGTIKFKQATDNVSLYAVEWNKTEVASTQQWFAALDIVPDVPTQASVDEAQNEALRAHTEILRQQQEINSLNTAFQEEQEVINATKNELDTLQGEAIKANSKVGDTNSTAIEALKAAVDSFEQIVSMDNAYRAQQEEIQSEILHRQKLMEEIQQIQNQMIARTIVREDVDIFDDYISLTGSKVTATNYNNWVGQIVVTESWQLGTGTNSNPFMPYVKIWSKPVPDGVSRSWDLFRLSGQKSRGIRVDYWVYPGKATTLTPSNSGSYISGSSFASGQWGSIWKTDSFPNHSGNVVFTWAIELRNADRGVYYELQVLVNGVVKETKWYTGKGPLLPWELGTDYINYAWSGEVPDGATFEIRGRTRSSNSSQAMVNSSKGKMTYIQQD